MLAALFILILASPASAAPGARRALKSRLPLASSAKRWKAAGTVPLGLDNTGASILPSGAGMAITGSDSYTPYLTAAKGAQATDQQAADLSPSFDPAPYTSPLLTGSLDPSYTPPPRMGEAWTTADGGRTWKETTTIKQEIQRVVMASDTSAIALGTLKRSKAHQSILRWMKSAGWTNSLNPSGVTMSWIRDVAPLPNGDAFLLADVSFPYTGNQALLQADNAIGAAKAQAVPPPPPPEGESAVVTAAQAPRSDGVQSDCRYSQQLWKFSSGKKGSSGRWAKVSMPVDCSTYSGPSPSSTPKVMAAPSPTTVFVGFTNGTLLRGDGKGRWQVAGEDYGMLVKLLPGPPSHMFGITSDTHVLLHSDGKHSTASQKPGLVWGLVAGSGPTAFAFQKTVAAGTRLLKWQGNKWSPSLNVKGWCKSCTANANYGYNSVSFYNGQTRVAVASRTWAVAVGVVGTSLQSHTWNGRTWSKVSDLDLSALAVPNVDSNSTIDDPFSTAPELKLGYLVALRSGTAVVSVSANNMYYSTSNYSIYRLG